MQHMFEELGHDVISHIFEYYSFRLFRYAHLILNNPLNTKQLHPSMIKLLYGYYKHDANRRITLLFSTVDLSGGFIYNAKAQEVELTDQIVYQMVPFKSIRGLDISKCDKLTQSVLEPLQFNNMKLKYLSIRGIRVNDDSFARYIGDCRNLESLDISYSHVSSQTMKLLFGPDRRFPYLTKLDLSFVGDEYSCVDMPPLFDNHRLITLSIFSNSYKSDTYDRIFSSRTLRELNFDHDMKLSQEVLRRGIQASTIPTLYFESTRRFECHEQLAENQYLTELMLSVQDAEPEKIQAIWRSKTLKHFTLLLDRAKLTGKNQPYLKGIENNSTLESLKLMRCSFYDFTPLTLNQSLVDLSLISCSLTDQLLTRLVQSKSRLTALNLFNNDLTEKCIETIMQLQLELLNIGWNELSPQFAITLASHPTLKTLLIRNSKIRNAGARALLQNPSITDLDISDNLLSDTCFGNGLELCPSLTRLDVRENTLSNTAAKVIFGSRGLIDVNMYSNNVGYLGVKSIEHNSSIRTLDLTSNPMNSEAKILLLNHPTLLTISMN